MRFPVSVSHWPPGAKRGKRLGSFTSVKDAEALIAELAITDADGVHRGDYTIDAPEEMVNGRSNMEIESFADLASKIRERNATLSVRYDRKWIATLKGPRGLTSYADRLIMCAIEGAIEGYDKMEAP